MDVTAAPVSMKDKTAIVGVGRTKVDRDPGANVVRHLGRALKAAVEDAGLSREDIDGIMLNFMPPPEAWMDRLPEMLGLPNVRWAFQSWAHGRNQPTCIAVACWAVLMGQANYVACMSAPMTVSAHLTMGVGAAAATYYEATREGGGPHYESPPYGLLSIGGGFAMAMRKYLAKYGGTEEELGEIAVALRQWAQTNPHAYFYGRPITAQDYLHSPYVVEPLRVLDHSLPGNAGFCIIVTTAERARNLRKPPVYVSGVQGSTSGKETFVVSRTGLGIGRQTDRSYVAPDMPVFGMAGVGPKDVDIFGALDPFSPCVLFVLEEFGFCKEGEALSWIQGGRIAPGGELPTNTCGGGLSDVECFGWGHEIDMVRHLRGEAGPAQVPGAQVAMYASTDRSAIILTRR